MAPGGLDQRGGRRLLIVAGEASGDLHASSLVHQLRHDPEPLEVWGVGGDCLAAQGVELLYHYRHLAVVGFTEVLAHLGDVRRAMNGLVAAVQDLDIDGVILVDYPDFNMALARRLRRVRPEMPIVYYISPQVWAWRAGRVRDIARLADRVLVILLFEKALYEDLGVAVDFVGHPLLDVIPAEPRCPREQLAARHSLPASASWVGLLPGSRKSEVSRLLDPLLGAASRLAALEGALHFLIPRASGVDRSEYEIPLAGLQPELRERVHLLDGDYYDLLRQCRAAVVCSGTATLEAALLGTPEVVVYRTSWLTYNLGKLLVRIRDIALVNVVAARRGVPELLQEQVTPTRIVEELVPLLQDGAPRRRCLEFLQEVRMRLGEPGASRRAARAVAETIVPPSVRTADDALAS